LFFEFSFEENEFLNLDFDHILNNFEEFEMYGGDDCLIDFYEKEKSKKDILNKFKMLDEDIAMVSIYFDHDEDGLIDLFLDVSKNII